MITPQTGRKVVYVSPNRSHHFRYAEGLKEFQLLSKYVQGFPRAKGTPVGLDHNETSLRDHFQLLYLAFYKLNLGGKLENWINFKSKNWIDAGFTKAMERAEIGLFYNGCGLNTLRKWKEEQKIFVCEAVNSHIELQMELLREEASLTGIEFEEPYLPEIEKRISEYQESDYILCPSKFVAESFLNRGVSSDRILINRFGVTLSEPHLRTIEKPKNAGFRLLYVGSINYRKGLRYLIEAFEQLEISQKELIIVGPELAPNGLNGVSIPKGVSFTGILKGDELQQAYLNADVFVQPSIEEGLSLVIGEALGHGLPVIATHNTGASEFYDDGVCGYHIPIRNPSIIAEKVTELADDPVKRKEFSQSALKLSQTFGGWKQSQASLCDVLRSIPSKS